MTPSAFQPAVMAADPPSRLSSRVLLVAACVLLVAGSLLALTGRHGFDYAVVRGLNRFAGTSVLLDHVTHDLTKESFSNVPMMALVWHAWCVRRSGSRHAQLIAGVLATLAAVALCYGLQVLLPDHLRPLNDPAITFRVPPAINPAVFSRGMAFPSEHAALMFGLATTVWLTDRRLGAIGFALACCLVTARVYLGFIFPTDIVTGAMLGVLAAGLAQASLLLDAAGRVVRWGERQPGVFAALSFYVCFGISRLFEDYRYVATGLMRVVKGHLGH